MGKPVEHMTITPALTDDVDLRTLSDGELAALRRELLEAAALPAGDE